MNANSNLIRYFFDLHIHTSLSPCASDDMTPNNIVNMALLKGLDFIAVTDHNSVGNVEAVMKCASDKDIVVIPGMEIESSEEVHLLCLFKTMESAAQMELFVKKHLPDIKNRPDIFGEQILYDEADNIIGYNENLLITATSLSVNRIKELADSLGGIVIPSHVDRDSFSIISNLGFIPEDLDFNIIEISKSISRDDVYHKFPYTKKYKVISNSDAHELYQISEPEEYFELSEKTVDCLFDHFRKIK